MEMTHGLSHCPVLTGVRHTGAAGVDPQKAVAVVTIEGGHEPHGVFSFATSARHLRTPETVGTAQLTIDRKFGAIGESTLIDD